MGHDFVTGRAGGLASCSRQEVQKESGRAMQQQQAVLLGRGHLFCEAHLMQQAVKRAWTSQSH